MNTRTAVTIAAAGAMTAAALVAVPKNPQPPEATRDYVTLKLLGHLPDTKAADVRKLGAGDPFARAAVTKYAKQFGELDKRICGHPDAVDPEIVESDPVKLSEKLGITADEALTYVQMHRALAARGPPHEATGSGSWPVGCEEEYPGEHVARFHVDKTGFSAAWLEIWDEVERDAIREAYAEVGLRCIRVETKPAADVLISARVLRGSVIGLAQFNNQSCWDQVFHYLNPNYPPNDLKNQLKRLVCHEFGHNCNLDHTRGGVMNPTILAGPFNGWEAGDPSLPVLARFFGGEPIDDKPKPDPQPPGDGATVTFRVGDEIRFTINEVELTARLTAIAGGKPPENPTKRLATEALAAVPDYGLREDHQSIVGQLYAKLAVGLESGQLKPADVPLALSTVSGLLLAGDAGKWQPVFAVAVGGAADAETVAAVLTEGRAVPAWLRVVLPIVRGIVERWEDSPRKRVALILLGLLEGTL